MSEAVEPSKTYNMCADCGDWEDVPVGEFCECGGMFVDPITGPIHDPVVEAAIDKVVRNW